MTTMSLLHRPARHMLPVLSNLEQSSEQRSLSVSDLRFPIGKFEAKKGLAETQIRELIESLGQAPLGLRAAIGGLTPQQLDTPYRPEGWTPRQVVNHVADSHINGYVRFKFALTE